MQSILLFTLLLSAGIAVNANAIAAPNKPPAGPQDVRVINTTAEPVPVTVQNPTTSVMVDNTSSNPVPVSGSVTVENSDPIPVSVQNQSSDSSTTQFVGFTTNSFDGGQGVVTYTNACQQDYPGSWMCNSAEFINSKTYPASTGTAWIKPTFVPVSTGSSSAAAVNDISGVIYIAGGTSPLLTTLSCQGWSRSVGDSNGLAVDGAGKYSINNCDNTFKVACCSDTP